MPPVRLSPAHYRLDEIRAEVRRLDIYFNQGDESCFTELQAMRAKLRVMEMYHDEAIGDIAYNAELNRLSVQRQLDALTSSVQDLSRK